MKTTINKDVKNNTIVYFHTGRGGRFYNQGHVTFCGIKDINEVMSLKDDSGHWLFPTSRDDKGRFCKPYYADSNGNCMITFEEAKTGVGSLDWDGQYDTDTCFFLKDCSETDLLIILESQQLDKLNIIEEYFNECTDLDIDWVKFNGDYEGIIKDYFNFDVDPEEYHEE